MCKWKTSLCIKRRKSDFGGAIRQMMPPYMLDGSNTVEMLIDKYGLCESQWMRGDARVYRW